MNILPPLHIIKLWRDEGLSPAEVYQRCENFIFRFTVSHSRPTNYSIRLCRLCSRCTRRHYAKGLCKRHYENVQYQSLKVRKVKLFT